MFDIDTRKKHTDFVFRAVDLILSTVTDDPHTKGLLAFFIHNWSLGLMLTYLTFGWVGPFYYAMIACYSSLFIMHFYFNGCICIRTERWFWKDDEWKGMWSLTFEILEKLGLTLTRSLENNVYIATSICMSFIVILRLVMHWM